MLTVKMPTLYLVAAIAVLSVWTLIAIANTVTGDYEGLQVVTPVMLVVSGALFALHRNGTR